jgi:predicted DNA repair protein MutK
MSGLLALLDDIAAIAKAAAASVDDVAGQAAKVGAKVAGSALDDAAKAGAKAAGVVIDDAAVTPKYVHGLPAARELPIVWAIAKGSLFNKLVILLPAALAIEAFAPWLLAPLLLVGGAYLCFEGAEKIIHWLHPHDDHDDAPQELDALHLEQARVKGAIKTDFILSAEIMTIALAAIEAGNLLTKGLVLAVVGVAITIAVYGAVALLVKADDAGLRLAQDGRTAAVRSLGVGIVRAMPRVMQGISTIGTLAMLWVGGSIVLHALDGLGLSLPYDTIHHIAEGVAHVANAGQGAVEWLVTAVLDGIVGLALGLGIVRVAPRVIEPLTELFSRRGISSARD